MLSGAGLAKFTAGAVLFGTAENTYTMTSVVSDLLFIVIWDVSQVRIVANIPRE